MADNRKYYYLKLKENYFDEDAIVLLESMQDGILYSNIHCRQLKKKRTPKWYENAVIHGSFAVDDSRTKPASALS